MNGDPVRARLDERLARSPVRDGFVERQHFADAAAALWLEGELVHLENPVLHDAHMDIRTPTHELTRACGAFNPPSDFCARDPPVVLRAPIRLDRSGVTFRYKDYRRSGPDRKQVMTIATDEFIRRFLLHILPRGLHRIRHYGLLAGSARKASLALARELLNVTAPSDHDTTDEPDNFRPPCPCCGGRMIVVEVFKRWRQPRGPPDTTSTNPENSP
jgi:hypothetical protein